MPDNVKGRPPVTSQGSGPDACSVTITTITIAVPGPPVRPPGAYNVSDLPPDVAERITVDPVTGCWLWRGATDKDGYGKCRGQLAHRLVYTLLAGPIPAGWELDHLCHTRDRACRGGAADPHRRCVCPADLEAVTGAENSRRGRSFTAVNAAKDECDHGHPFDLFNTYWRPNGHRDCRICTARRQREYKGRQRTAPAAAAGKLAKAA